MKKSRFSEEQSVGIDPEAGATGDLCLDTAPVLMKRSIVSGKGSFGC